jgi:hypothetical protein
MRGGECYYEEELMIKGLEEKRSKKDCTVHIIMF